MTARRPKRSVDGAGCPARNQSRLSASLRFGLGGRLRKFLDDPAVLKAQGSRRRSRQFRRVVRDE